MNPKPAHRWLQFSLRGLLLLMIVIAVALGCLVWAWQVLNVSARNALPLSATEIHEWLWDPGFLPDYKYHLKARINLDEFRSYVARLHLTPHTPTRSYDESPSPWLNWSQRVDLPWWNPSPSLDTTFVFNRGDGWTFAKYENGYVYVTSLNH